MALTGNEPISAANLKAVIDALQEEWSVVNGGTFLEYNYATGINQSSGITCTLTYRMDDYGQSRAAEIGFEKPGTYLVSNTEGGRKDYHNFREREYYPLLERLGIPKRTLHTTRHTFASMAVKSDMRPEDLQKIMGHADYSVTANIYAHADEEELTKAIRMLK